MFAPQSTDRKSRRSWNGRSTVFGFVVGALLMAGFGLCCPCTLVSAQDKSAGPATSARESKARARSDQSELTVPPEKVEIVNEDQRPAWVERQPYTEAGVLYIPVAGDPKPYKHEATESAVRAAIERARQHARKTTRGRSPDFLTEEFIRSRLIEHPAYVEEIRSPTFGTLFMGHVRLKLDRTFTSQLDEWKRAVEQRERVEATAVLAGGTLIVMALAGLWLGRKSRRAAHLQHWEPPPGMAEATAAVHGQATSNSSNWHSQERRRGWGLLVLIAVIACGIISFRGVTYTVTREVTPAIRSGPMPSSAPQTPTSSGRRRLIGKVRTADGDADAPQAAAGVEARETPRAAKSKLPAKESKGLDGSTETAPARGGSSK